MKLLFFGDIVGRGAVAYLSRRIPAWRSDHALDAVVANAENASVSDRRSPLWGFGCAQDAVAELFAAGVDVITGGNHSWDASDNERVLAEPRVLRPLNIEQQLPGKGSVTIETHAGALVIINLLGESASTPSVRATNPLTAFDSVAAARGAITIVDFHADSVQEKEAFAHAVDGRTAAVLGTHTHEPTVVHHRLPKGTVFVADVGMNGPTGGVQGIAPDFFVRRLHGHVPESFELAQGPFQLGAVLLTVTPGSVTTVARFRP